VPIQFERKQAYNVAFLPSFGGCFVSQSTAPIYAIALFGADKIRLTSIFGLVALCERDQITQAEP
jgi:hypothetical protein